MDELHERLAHIRSETGLGLRSFAREVEERTGYVVSHTTVSSYESGGTVPVGYALAVADAFDLEPRWLVSGEGEPRRNGLEDFFRRYPEPALAVEREDLTLLDANEAFRREFGEGQDHGGRLLFLLHPEDRDDVQRALDDANRRPVRARIRSGDGYRPVLFHPFEGQEAVFCALRDVGESVHAEPGLDSDRERTGP